MTRKGIAAVRPPLRSPWMTDLPGPGDDAAHMATALEEARVAVAHEDVPIGAVVVRSGEVIARARNRREAEHDPTGHAEVLALREAGKHVSSWRLAECALYVTLEPCVMCAGALMHARVGRVVYGAPDPKTGACGSVVNLFAEARLNHHARVDGGVLSEACAGVLREFFASRRD